MDYLKINDILENLEINKEPNIVTPTTESDKKEKYNFKSDTLKDETNTRINSYNNTLGFSVGQNKQDMAAQIDFKTFLNPNNNKQVKHNINDKLATRENFIFQGVQPTISEMVPKNTREVNKVKQNF